MQHALGEQCEAANHPKDLPYSCDANCRYALLHCGNGQIDPGEECDEGTLNSNGPNALCRRDCSRARCGDAVIDSGESCDDGNLLPGDGCSRICQLEPGAGLIYGQSGIGQSPYGIGPWGSQLGTPLPFGQGQIPQYPNSQPLPYNLPLAQIAATTSDGGPYGDTGRVAAAVMASGAAAGFAWVRRKRRG